MPRRLVTKPGRTWLYGIALAVLPILVATGIITEEVAVLWGALAAAIFVPGIALSDAAKEPEQNKTIWQDGYDTARRHTLLGVDDLPTDNPYCKETQKRGKHGEIVSNRHSSDDAI